MELQAATESQPLIYQTYTRLNRKETLEATQYKSKAESMTRYSSSIFIR